MTARKFLVQRYVFYKDRTGGTWQPLKAITCSFHAICKSASRHAKAQKIGYKITLYSNGEDLVVFRYGEKDGIYYALYTALGERLLKIENKQSRNEQLTEEENKDEQDEAEAKELSGHRDKEQAIADSREQARKKYNHIWNNRSTTDKATGRNPRIYRCGGCRMYFCIPSERRTVSCPHCRSSHVRRVSFRK